MVSKAWVSSTQFGSKGGEKGGEKKSGKYLQNRITLHLPFPITEGNSAFDDHCSHEFHYQKLILTIFTFKDNHSVFNFSSFHCIAM